jgi:zinc transporter
LVIDWYLLDSGVLRRQPPPAAWPGSEESRQGESWIDISDAGPDEVREFLAPLGLHPLALERCVATAGIPGVITYGPGLVVEFPAGIEPSGAMPTHVTMVLQEPFLVTVRRGSMPELDDLPARLAADGAPPIEHLAQIVYEVIDALADERVKAGIELRDQLARASQTLADRPDAITAADLGRLHEEVGALVSLIENQLYSVAALNASDNEALRHPHRKAYIQDLASELELAQRGAYRLEARVHELDAAVQLASSSRVDRRLRILTVVSAVTLPLGLLTGLLGMSVGGVPGIHDPNGFVIVSLFMVAIVGAELWYFRRAGWFD